MRHHTCGARVDRRGGARYAVSMPRARVNDIDLYYEVHGQGEPLLFISGLGGHLAEIPHLVESHREHVRFIPFDGRGCGRSDTPAGEYTISGYADDAAGLLDVLGIPAAFVYGSSMGGMVAQELVLRHPRRVRGLILGCTTPGALRGERPANATVQRMIANLSLSGDEALVAGWKLGYSDAYIDANYDAMIARSRQSSQYGAPRDSYLRQVSAAARHDTHDRLHEIACPVMIIHGRDDAMMPVRNAELLKDGIPHAELHILDGMGHGYNLEAQGVADALVLDFVRRHSVGESANADGAASTTHAVR